MAMGRPPKPTAAHVLEDTHRGDRHGDIDSTWQPDGEPEVPSWLQGDALQLWRELSPRLVTSKVATSVDAAELAALCDWWARYREASRVADQIADKRGTDFYRCSILASMAWKNFTKAAANFGLNPADRARLKLPDAPKAEDELLVFSREREERASQ